jgi:hypothetical protein
VMGKAQNMHNLTHFCCKNSLHKSRGVLIFQMPSYENSLNIFVTQMYYLYSKSWQKKLGADTLFLNNVRIKQK